MTDYGSERQSNARRAFGDPEASIRAHGRMIESFNVDIRKNGAMQNRALVIAAAAGICSSASWLAILHSSPDLLAPLLRSSHALKAVGWVLASGLGLGYVIISTLGFERTIYDLELRRELWEIDNHLSGELQEMIEIYTHQGLSEEDALVVTRIFAKQKTLFAKLMMVEELGYSRLEPPTWQEAATSAALPSVVGYVLGLLTPFLPIFVSLRSFSHATASGGNGSVLQTSAGGRAVPAAAVAAAARWTGVAALCLTSTLVSVLQSEVFFGAYAQLHSTCRVAAMNLVGLGSVYALTYAAARYL